MYTLISQPSEPIIPLEEVKTYLKIENDLEDTLVLSLLDAAEDAANKYMLRYIRETKFEYFEQSSASTIMLRRARFSSVDKVSILVGADWVETEDFEISSDSDIYGVVNIGTPHSACRIQFTVGFKEVPPALKTAILIIVANMYENRGDDAEYSVIPQMAKQILNGYRVIRAR